MGAISSTRGGDQEVTATSYRPTFIISVIFCYHRCYITISLIVFDGIPLYIIKRCNNQSLRRWYTLINIFKTTLYALYYRRPLFDRNGSIIIRTFNHHLRAAKRAATERKSDILEKIFFLPEKDDSVTPFL